MTSLPDIAGIRVMLLEDDSLVSIVMEDILQLDLGCMVLGPFMNLQDAFDFVRDHSADIDIAILDVNIQGERSFELAEQLQELKIPFFFSTGHNEATISRRWPTCPCTGKLITGAQLATVISQQMANSRADGRSRLAGALWQQILL